MCDLALKVIDLFLLALNYILLLSCLSAKTLDFCHFLINGTRSEFTKVSSGEGVFRWLGFVLDIAPLNVAPREFVLVSPSRA